MKNRLFQVYENRYDFTNYLYVILINFKGEDNKINVETL